MGWVTKHDKGFTIYRKGPSEKRFSKYSHKKTLSEAMDDFRKLTDGAVKNEAYKIVNAATKTVLVKAEA